MTLEGSRSANLLPDEGDADSIPSVFPPPGFVQAPSSISGIEVFAPGESVAQRPEVVDFKCPQCGATIAYSVTEGGLTCEHCGFTQPIHETRLGQAAEGFEFRVETLQRSEKGWGDARKELVCQHCGGVVSSPPDIITFACPFCGSNKVLFREPLEDVLRPRYMIPFKVSPEECCQSVQEWLGSSWMLPLELREKAGLEKYHPIYIPYWTFSAMCNATWKAQVARVVVERQTIKGQVEETRHIEWRNEAGKVQKQITDMLVPGTTQLNLGVLAQVDNYETTGLILYEPAHLAGMNAQAYNLPLEEAWDAGRHIMRERTRQACLDRTSSTNVRAFRMTLDFSDEQWRYILAPIYTSVYHYQNKSFQILVNGQTGRIAGPRPVDWEKVWMVVAALLTPGLLLAVIGWLFTARQSLGTTSLIGLFLLVVGIAISLLIIFEARGIEDV
jgi:predicted RNA-binding Zn-ribbon protein involved in translation (DUF1610 family)